MTIINTLCIIFFILCIAVLYFSNDNIDENINGYDCVITKNLGNGYYEVSVKTKNGVVIKKEVQSINHNTNIKPGEIFIIRKYYYGYFIYQKN